MSTNRFDPGIQPELWEFDNSDKETTLVNMRSGFMFDTAPVRISGGTGVTIDAQIGAGIIESVDEGGGAAIKFGTGLLQFEGKADYPYCRRNIHRFFNDLSGLSGRYLHVKTDAYAPANGVIPMWRAHWHGFVYGSSANIEAFHVGYCYRRSFTVSAGSGTHSCGAYLSADNYLVLTLYLGAGSNYYSGALLDVEGSQQGIPFYNIIGSIVTGSPTGAY